MKYMMHDVQQKQVLIYIFFRIYFLFNPKAQATANLNPVKMRRLRTQWERSCSTSLGTFSGQA